MEFEQNKTKNLDSAPSIEGIEFSLNSKVSEYAIASDSGLDQMATEALSYVHSMPPAYKFPPQIARKERVNPYGFEETTTVVRSEITIPCEGHVLKARVYNSLTRSKEKQNPALVYFHGGGFVLGSLNTHDKMLARLCELSKVTVISVAYRLAPETVFPGAVEDAQSAIDWIAKNHQALHINPNRIAVGGDSAGANLATVYCIQNKRRTDFKPCLQLLIYPSIFGNDTSKSRESFSEGLLLTKELLRWFHDLYVHKTRENDPRFNVSNVDDVSGIPQAFIMTGGFDPLRDEGQFYANKLANNGVVVRHSCYSDMFHGFINYGALKQAQDAVSECAVVLKKATA